ncbi:hypothetical protein [Methylibium petroleiphilum]|uniref:Uncharacterized protein n=1 Tax=Methylibium petroleiphilum (strain ATCC BAA-1232 / LMG 22953 / PM1) TaxID=420662 RepID=A2SGW2_METPP|nr:hypothetical protein [Methylibium petroleiphilum]ABM94801.1 hypothetical protein Mpe_A1843 [Methylibium petroleiphilum PM1]
MSAALDAAAGDPYYTQSLPGDWSDTAKMAPFQPAAAGSSWWEGAIQYGLVRAIDNRFGPVNIAGNNQPGTFAGANGRTYTQAPNATGQTLLGGALGGGMGTWLLLGGVALAAFALLKR